MYVNMARLHRGRATNSIEYRKITKTKENKWAMLSDNEAKWIAQLEANSSGFIGNMFKVRVGIKTTADKVFIKDSWDNLNVEKPENENLKDLLSQENIKSSD